MGQALYRKYRSKSLAQIVGQEHITDTLVRALESGRISHAYLFSGPRGVGKTSIARILAHEINGLPYTDDSNHMDIIEIDAASNNSVEDVRDLREKVYVAPSSAKYKVYIIDEVHMLSKAAFNALLKTLEEPPAHVVFILATTLASKLPDTIISRTQHYTFKPVEQSKVVAHLRYIAETEHVQIDDEALALLAAHGEGSFRDSISLLDQTRSISSLGDSVTKINSSDIRQLLGIAPDEAIEALITTLRTSGQTGQAGMLLRQVGELYGQGLQAAAIASQLSATLRSSLLASKPALGVGQTLALLRALIEVPASRNPERLLEIVLLDAADTSSMAPVVPVVATSSPTSTTEVVASPAALEAAPTPAATPPAAVSKPAARPAAAKSAKKAEQAKVTEPAKPQAVASAGPAVVQALDAKLWPQVLDGIKKEYNTLYGVLRMATPIFSDEGVELQFKFLFHQKRLNEVKNKQIIAKFIKQITGSDIAVVCTYAKPSTPGDTPFTSEAPESPSAGEPVASGQTMETISNIFGGGEVL